MRIVPSHPTSSGSFLCLTPLLFRCEDGSTILTLLHLMAIMFHVNQPHMVPHVSLFEEFPATDMAEPVSDSRMNMPLVTPHLTFPL